MFYLLTPVPLICFIRSDAVLVELKAVHSVGQVGNRKVQGTVSKIVFVHEPNIFLLKLCILKANKYKIVLFTNLICTIYVNKTNAVPVTQRCPSQHSA